MKYWLNLIKEEFLSDLKKIGKMFYVISDYTGMWLWQLYLTKSIFLKSLLILGGCGFLVFGLHYGFYVFMDVYGDLILKKMMELMAEKQTELQTIVQQHTNLLNSVLPDDVSAQFNELEKVTENKQVKEQLVKRMKDVIQLNQEAHDNIVKKEQAVLEMYKKNARFCITLGSVLAVGLWVAYSVVQTVNA